MEVLMRRHFSALLFAFIALGLAFMVNSLHHENTRLQLALDRQLNINNLRIKSFRTMQDEAFIQSLEQQVDDLRMQLVRFTEEHRELNVLNVQKN
jgi:hypothetical protein